MKFSFLKTYSTPLFLFLITLIILPLYLYKLGTIPINITGDDSTYLGVVYRILYGKDTISIFELMEDHTKAALAFYWMGMIIKVVGLENTPLGMRLSIVIPSIGILFTFFILLKQRTNELVAFAFTIMFGTNVLFLNFARSGWFNLVAVFFGLLMILFLENGLKTRKNYFFIAAGFCAAFSCYWYLSGYIYPISTITYFFILFFTSRKNLLYFRKFLLFLLIAGVTILPIFISGYFQREESLARPSNVFIFNHYNHSLPLVLFNQSWDVTQGLVLLNGDTIGKSYENPRYFPVQTPLVDPFIRILFICGLLYFGYKMIKKPFINIWIVIFAATSLTVGILTIDAPNLARTIPILPCIYFLAAVTFLEIIRSVQKRIPVFGLYYLLFVCTLLIAFKSTTFYFAWAQSSQVRDDRQPAIEYDEFQKWQQYQIQLIQVGGLPIINYQWYNIRDSL